MMRLIRILRGAAELGSAGAVARFAKPRYLFLGLFLAAAAVIVAQDELPTFTVDTREVDVYVSVGDKDGKPITGVPKSAFKILENGVEQPIKVFSNEDVPVSMGIVIDNSGSMRDKKANVNAASMGLVKASNPSDEVFIIGFNDNAYMDQEFTSDTKLLEAALDKTETRGGTAMRDAIHLALDYMKGQCAACTVKGAKRDKKVILVITDGNDNTSDETLEQLVREARQSGVLIYSIGLLDQEIAGEARAAKRALKALAEASGGMDYYPKTLAEVEKITPQVAKEIRNQYLLGYTPLNTALDGKYRTIEVKVNIPGKPNVRYRNGYYASTDAQGNHKAPPPPAGKSK
ncbi:MAG TPA: VWA domain-containing protein [Bryobacteraceae bacterium]|jgi:VWFA-related protein